MDLSKETDATKKLYGIGEQLTDDFGRKCLLARRLVERGVRFIQLYSGTNIGEDWDDAHTDLQTSHTKMCKKTDQPITALLTDLKARGMLDSTLVVWNSEFGRTPLAEGTKGRDHHPYVFSMWMAGAGIQGGQVLGSSDDFGLRPQEMPCNVHDVNATILRLIGMDHTRLTYLYQSRDMRLTDVHGENEFTKRLIGAERYRLPVNLTSRDEAATYTGLLAGRGGPLLFAADQYCSPAQRHMHRSRSSIGPAAILMRSNAASALTGELCAFGRLLGRSQIHLRNLIAGGLSRIADGEAHIQPAICRREPLASVNNKRRVRKPVPEREQRRQVLLVEPAVSHEDAFRVRGPAVDSAVGTLGMRRIVGQHLIQAPRPGKRQPSRRVGAAQENVRRRRAALIARPPHLHHRLHLCRAMASPQESSY